MTIDEAIQHCEEVAEKQDKLCEISVTERAKEQNSKCAEEHRQLAKWLKALKAYRDARAEIAEAFYDDARGEQNDYERGRKSGIFLCESIISVKLGESSSENPNTCGDAISREPFTDSTICEGFSCNECSFNRKDKGGCILEERVMKLPPVTPQQRTGRWILTDDDFVYCSECEDSYYPRPIDASWYYCPHCGCKMEVEE